MVRRLLAALVLIVLTAVACSTPPASPLTVASQSPSPGATGVAPNAVVAVVFDRDLDAATLAGGFTLTAGDNPVPGVASYDAATRTARFRPSDPLEANTTHIGTVSTTVRGTDGARLASPLIWTFTTGAAEDGVPVAFTITPSTGGNVTANRTSPVASGTQVTFTATPASGFTHTAWGGACTDFNAGQDCVLTLTTDVTISATFAAITSPVAFTITPSTGGNVNANRTSPVASGTLVTFTATPDSGFTHSAWGGACAAVSAGQPCTLTVTSPITVSATFTAVVPGPVAYTIIQSTGGNVTAEPPSPVASGTLVTFTATPDSGFTHSAWGGACAAVSAGQPCTLTVTSPITVSATFTADPEPETFAFQIDPSPGGNITASASSPVPSGTDVTFTATPDSGFTHTAWGGACDGEPAGEPCTLTITADVTVSATFTADPLGPITVAAGTPVASATATKSLTLARPAGVATDDLLLAQITYRAAARTLGSPDGWTQIDELSRGRAGTSLTQALFWKRATAEDAADPAATYTWTVSGDAILMSAAPWAFGNVNYGAGGEAPVLGVESATEAGNSSEITVPSIEDAPAGSAVVALFTANANYASGPNGLTIAYSTSVTATNGLLGAHQLLAEAGPTGTKTAALGANNLIRIGHVIVLRPY